jgi:hypothetical protein
MAWRLATSLIELRSECDAQWPNRSKVSDGTIGDTSHAATPSDHNPNAADVVCAFDCTNDPINGPDIAVLGPELLIDPHPDLKYLIFNRQIASRTHGFTLRSYTGSDPHTSHIHISVGVGPDGQSQPPYDDILPHWLASTPSPLPTGDDMPLHLIQGNKSGQWWLTDLVTKRYVQSPNQAAEIIVSTRANKGVIECSDQNGPVVYDQSFVDAIPSLP